MITVRASTQPCSLLSKLSILQLSTSVYGRLYAIGLAIFPVCIRQSRIQDLHCLIFVLSAMGRTRPRPKKSKLVKAEPTSQQSQQPSVSALLEKAQALIVQCDYPLAERFIRRILERDPNHAEAREMLAVALLETGELEAAKQVDIQPPFVACTINDIVFLSDFRNPDTSPLRRPFASPCICLFVSSTTQRG